MELFGYRWEVKACVTLLPNPILTISFKVNIVEFMQFSLKVRISVA